MTQLTEITLKGIYPTEDVPYLAEQLGFKEGMMNVAGDAELTADGFIVEYFKEIISTKVNEVFQERLKIGINEMLEAESERIEAQIRGGLSAEVKDIDA